MHQYNYVIGGFTATCIAAAVYTIMNPQQSFSKMPVIDESAMLVHNGQSHRFTQASNAFFNDLTIADTKKLFETGLSDNPNVEPCKSGQNEGMVIPDAYDWREENAACVQAPLTQSQNCSAGYLLSTISAAQDRICAKGGRNEQVQLSYQELVDCDNNSECLHGTVNKVLTWGKRRGFLPEVCYPNEGK